MAYYDFGTVRSAAGGNWLGILERLAPELSPAIARVGRHVPCPVRGGRDGFRLFKDAHETGGGVSNQEGTFHDGFALLMWIRGWSFTECVKEVAEELGVPSEKGPQKPPAVTTPQDLENAKKYIGKILDFGKAPYQNKPENETSFFVKLAFRSGAESMFWGVDLERAIGESGVEVGAVVTMANLGRVPVTLIVDKKDARGQVVGQKEISTFRNTWVILPKAKNAAPVKAQEEKEAKEAPRPVKMKLKPWVAKAQENARANLERDRQKRAQAAEKLLKVWNESIPYTNGVATGQVEPLRRYFLSRNILFRMNGAENQDNLRFHPGLAYLDEDGKFVREYPALVCAIRNLDGEIVTLHRTYLTPSGKKAPEESARKMMPVPEGMSITGAAIQLGVPDGVLGVAEGLETALSAYKATQVPTWSAINAWMLESIEIPASVHTVLIWADKDKSVTGEKSAKALKKRLQAEGIKAHILMPQVPRGSDVKSIDWNDVLCTQGLFGFPRIKHLCS